MSVSIDLTTTVTVTKSGKAVQLQVVAVGTGVSSKIFAIEVLPAAADTAAPMLRFSHICSPAELLELPAEQRPEYSYFRTDDVEFLFDSITPVEAVKKTIAADVRLLVQELNALEELPGTTSTIIVGA